MPRTGRYLKQPRAGHCPACLVSVLVDSCPDPRAPESATAVPALFRGIHWAWQRRSHNKWSDRSYRFSEYYDEFWEWLERWTLSGRRAYIFAPLASDVLTMTGFWPRVTKLGGRFRGQSTPTASTLSVPGGEPAFVFGRLVLRGKPDIVEYSLKGKSYTWLSVNQYVSLPDSAVAVVVGRLGSKSAGPSPSVASATYTSPERCTLYLELMRTLGSWWESLSAGGFGRTIGQMSYSFMRSRLSPKSISTHSDERAIKLERLACHGGRASTWFYGDCISRGHTQSADIPPLPDTCRWKLGYKLYSVDVRSMYPHIMATTDTPTKLLSVSYSETPDGVAGLCSRYCVVASVSLDTPHAEYPHRRGEFVDYPVGRFTAILCGPELERACLDGVVKKVHCCLIYQRGRPFERAAVELLDMRDRARASGDVGWETFVKLLANSLTGKLAQRSAVWTERPNAPAEVEWGEWVCCGLSGKAPIRWRALAGMVWELVRGTNGTGLLPACYAHITSHGRNRMRTIRESIPRRSVVSQDTDGLWVTPDARRVLDATGQLASDAAGALRVDRESTASRFYGPKHYYASERWTLSGLHNPHTVASDLTFYDTYTSNLARSSSDAPPTTVHLHTREVTLSTIPHDGVIGPDGWQIPTRLPVLPASRMPVFDSPNDNPQPLLPDC